MKLCVPFFVCSPSMIKKFKNCTTLLSDLSWRVFWRGYSGLKRILLHPFVVSIARTQLVTWGGLFFFFFFLLCQMSLFCWYCMSSILSRSYLQWRMKLKELVVLCSCAVAKFKRYFTKNQEKHQTSKYSAVRFLANAWLCYLILSLFVVFHWNTLLGCRWGHLSSQFLIFATYVLLYCVSPLNHCSVCITSIHVNSVPKLLSWTWHMLWLPCCWPKFRLH